MANSIFRNITADSIDGLVAVKNYVPNGNFEKNNLENFSLFTTTLTGTTPTGTITAGATSLNALALVTTGQLSGSYSMSMSSAGAITAGQGFISQVFTIESEAQAKRLASKFSYSVISGITNLNLSGTTSNTFAVYFYDLVNSTWIQPDGAFSINQSGTNSAQSGFQTSYNGNQYRIAIICINASAGASTIYFDNFSISQQSANLDTPVGTTRVSGAAASASASSIIIFPTVDFDTTGSFNASTGQYQASAPGYINVQAHLMANASIGYSVFVNNTVVKRFCISDAAGGEASGSIVVRVNTGDVVDVRPVSTSGAFNINSFICFTRVLGSGSDNGANVISASVSASTTLSTAASTPVLFDVVDFDTTGSYNPTNGRYTISSPGIYCVAFTNFVANTTIGDQIQLWKNGSLYRSMNFNSPGSPAASGFLEIKCNSGDYLQIVIGGTGGLYGIAYKPTVSFTKVQGSTQTGAGVTVACSYYASVSGTTSTTQSVNFDSKIYDSHNAVTVSAPGTGTWKFTAPFPGIYNVGGNLSDSGSRYYALAKNGSIIIGCIAFTDPASGTATPNYDIKLVTGDTIDVRVNAAATTWAGGALTGVNIMKITIKKVGEYV